MPNWTSNELSITGSITEIKKFKKQASSIKDDGYNCYKEFSLQAFVPMPEELKGTSSPQDEKLGKETWYTWCNREWSVKWDVSDEYLAVDKPDHLEYVFQSPWCPPMNALIKISKLYPSVELSLKWIDEDDQFNVNEVTMINGKEKESGLEVETI